MTPFWITTNEKLVVDRVYKTGWIVKGYIGTFTSEHGYLVTDGIKRFKKIRHWRFQLTSPMGEIYTKHSNLNYSKASNAKAELELVLGEFSNTFGEELNAAA